MARLEAVYKDREMRGCTNTSKDRWVLTVAVGGTAAHQGRERRSTEEENRDTKTVGKALSHPAQHNIAHAEANHYPGGEAATGRITHRRFGTTLVSTNAGDDQTSSPGGCIGGRYRSTTPSL